jgi:peptidoglycan/LPS O-acetylase OafA/YrhL
MYIGKTEPYNTLFLNGGFGVDLFFLISGFIISFVTDIKRTNIVNFYIKRFFRIYPSFLFILIISSIFLIRYNVHPIWSMIKSGLLILQDYNKPAPAFDFNFIGPAWTLSYEFWFYFIFGISILIDYKRRIEIATVILILQVFVLQVAFTGGISLDSSYVASIGDSSYLDHMIKFFSNTLHLEFIAGMWIYVLYKNCSPSTNKYAISVIIATLFISSVLLYLSTLVYGSGLTSFYLIALPLFISVILLEKNFNISNYRVLFFFGDISFSIYITHFFIMYLIVEHPPYLWSEMGSFLKLISSTCAAIAFAFVTHRLIELPFKKFGRRFEVSKIENM